MRATWHELWGSARGPTTRLAPQIRLLAGALVFFGCMLAPAADEHGALFIAVATTAWLAACEPPPKTVWTAVGLGLALFLPYFLLLPLLPAPPAASAGGFWPMLRVPWTLLVRGMSGILVSLATVTTLSASDLREALVRLPVPAIVSAILVQIVHQTATLFYETKRVAAAMAVRGATSGGRAAWRVLAAVPSVWLPRILERADRVAAAMELRGYCESELPCFEPRALRLGDVLALLLALGALGAGIMLRLGGAP